jgi:hypothetical protein
MGRAVVVIGVVLLTRALGALDADEGASREPLPPGVEQLLPRGRIAAVFEPVFVSAAEAEIAADAWVLGVEIDGQPKAYSLNLLNRHEVVNDESGGTKFAAVW